MIVEEKELYTLEGRSLYSVLQYEESDIYILQELYTCWMKLNSKIKKVGGRNSILPQEFVEALVSYKLGYWRLGNPRLGFDCFDSKAQVGKNRIGIKYGTNRTDFSVFSSKQRWDRLNFVIFYNESPTDCFFEIYDMDYEMISKQLINNGITPYNQHSYVSRISVIRQLIDQKIYNSKKQFSLF